MAEELPPIEQVIAGLGDRPARLIERLLQEAAKLGCEPPALAFDDTRKSLERDPFSGAVSLRAEWRDDAGQLKGSLLFHADDSFFAEYDILQPHPRLSGQFVEAVTAWGRGDDIKTEPRLLEMP